MPETKLKDLYMASCLEDLDKQCNVPDLKDKRVKIVCNTAQKLFACAEEERLKRDEEKSYIFYMKYLDVVQSLKSSNCYKTEKQYILDMIGPKNPFKALDCAEKLKDSLKLRYVVHHQLRKLQDLEEQEEVRQKIEADRRKAKETHAQQRQAKVNGGLPSKNDVSIKCMDLYTLLEDGAKKILVLDARPSINFVESHIKYPQSISVPEECIIAGLTANKLEKNLPVESKQLWSQRKHMDLIVLLDWSSSDVVPGKTLHTLKTILDRWDPQVIYKRPPVILEGGYEEWVFGYPTKTTNPRVSPPNHNATLDDLLNDIDYPIINDSLSPTDKKPTLDRNFKPFSVNISNYGQVDSSYPSIDRSSKAAALLTYEENSKAMKAVLEEQEKLADSSLNIVKQRVQAEQNWESLRLAREKEAEDGMRAKHQLREHEILSELLQLENIQWDLAMENQQLKEQLAVYKNKEMLDAAKMAEKFVDKGGDSSGTSSVSNGSPIIHHSDKDNFSVDDGKELENNAMETILEAARLEEAQREAKRVAEEAIIKERRIKAIEEEEAALNSKREQMQVEREKKLAEAREQKKLMNLKQQEDADDDIYSTPLNNDGNSSGMNRSHSSPNLAQMMDDDDCMKGKTPQFDRTMKPLHKSIVSSDINQARQRDFQEVWGCPEPLSRSIKKLP